MQDLILEIQDRMAFYAKHARSNRDALKALESLKELSGMLHDVEEVEAHLISLGRIQHG